MPRLVRNRFRLAVQSGQTFENPLLLVTIVHPDLPKPIRISSDPTVRISTEPLLYGTQSKLIGSETDEGNLALRADFLFTMMSFGLPEDREEGTTSSDITFENLGADDSVQDDMVEVVRSFSSPATVHFAVVLAADPDYVDFEWTDLRTVEASYDDTSVTISVSREDRMSYAAPFGRMTKSRFPGLHR